MKLRFREIGVRAWRQGLTGLAAAALAVSAAAAALAQQPATAPQTKGKAQAATPPPAATPPSPPPGPVGIWIDHTGRGAVEIAPCAANLCGRIVWMQEPNDKKGQPLRDKLNEDRRLRERLICGLQVIGGLKPMRDGSWDGGWIYDPEQGASFDVELRMRAPDMLQVKGYKGFKFLSETFQWRRASALPTPGCPRPGPGPA